MKVTVQLFLIALLVCIGCHKNAKHGENTLKINFQEGDLSSLHPHDLALHLRGLSLAKILFEPLTRINAEGRVMLAGAKSVHLSSDHLTYTFILRDNTWSNGAQVTAHQYEVAWKSALSPQSRCARADLLYCIKNGEEAKKGLLPLDRIGVKAIDAKTLVVDLAYPSPHFLELAAHAIACPLGPPGKMEQGVFNGPFAVSEWKKESLRLKPNPYYWDRMDTKLDEIEIYATDLETIFSMYENGNLNWIDFPSCSLSEEKAQNQFEKLQSKAMGSTLYLSLNTKHPALASASIRRALSCAIEREWVANNILIGSQPSKKVLPAQLLSSHSSQTIKEGSEEAQKEFEKGLKELCLTRETFPILEIIYPQQANREHLAEYLKERWHHTLGIAVRLKAEELNVLKSNLEKGLFTISMDYAYADYHDPLELLEKYATYSPSNYSQWFDPTFKQKTLRAKYEKNEAKRIKLLREAESILIEEIPFIPICTECLLFTHNPRLKGYVIDSTGAIDFSRAKIK